MTYHCSPDEKWDKPTGGLNQLVSEMMPLQVFKWGPRCHERFFLKELDEALEKMKVVVEDRCWAAFWAPTKCIKL